MKKLFLYIFLVLMFFTPNNLYAWEKVPVPDYVDKKTKSPWNFYDDFEDQKFNKYIHSSSKNYKTNRNKVGKKPYKFKKDSDGNTYMEVTVKHGWNKCCSESPADTERAEFSPKYKKIINKEIWYGFRLRFPKDFKYVNDRILITQFKNQFNPMKQPPLFSIHYYSIGKELDIGGNTGGIAGEYWSKDSNIINSVNLIYFKNKKDDKWFLARFKKRNSKKFPVFQNCYNPYLDEFAKEKRKFCDDEYLDFDKATDYLNTDKSNSIKGINNFNATKLGEWTTYKIGIRNSKKEDGFVKVYKDNQLIMDYKGVTFKWKGNYIGTIIRLGPYRDTDPSGKGYPPQSIHYDDFTIVSDKKTLDKYLN